MTKSSNGTLFFKNAAWMILGVAGAVSGCSSTPVRQEAAPRVDSQAKERSTGNNDSQSTESVKRATQQAQKNTEASAEYHFSMAQAYVAEGNPDRAIEEYKLTLMFDPNSSLVYARLATEYVKKGMLSAAMEACKEALQRDPHFVDARLMLAGLYLTTRETGRALSEYDQILKLNPKHEEAAVYRAQALAEDGRVPDAAKSLQKFVKGNPESVLAWFYLARMEHQQNHTKEAVRGYQKALELKPGFTQAALALGYLYEEKGQNAQAIATYRAIYEENQDASAANRLATIYLKQEKYTAAIPYLEAIAAADPEEMNARVKLGLVYMELKKFDQSVQIFQKILEKNPDSDRVHYYLGSIFEETKKPELAIKELVQIKPDSKLFGDAMLHSAYLIKQNKTLGDPLVFIQSAIAQSPRFAGFFIFQASLEEEAKNYDQAVKTLQIAAERFPEDEKVHYFLGTLYDRQGKPEKGIEQMEAILKVNPQNVDALNYIGYTWTQKGIRLNDAEKLLRRALTLKPDNGYIQDSWGWYLFVRGRVNEAVVELEKAAKLKPNEPTILEHLGDAYLRSNLREKALQQYTEAAKITEDEKLRAQLQKKADGLNGTAIVKEMTDSPSDRAPAASPPPTR